MIDKIHWYNRIHNDRSSDIFKYTVAPGINLSVNTIIFFEKWCERQFGPEKSLLRDGSWERVGAGFFTFKKKEDMLLFLLIWQDMEIE